MVKDLVESRGISVAHKKDLKKYISQVFEHALDNRKTNHNPARRIVVQGDKSHREKAKQLSAMTKSEVHRFLERTKELSEDWYAIFYVTYFLGLRSGEAQALKFENIEWDKNQVVINSSWCKKKKGHVPPKNNKSRIVPISNNVKIFLRELNLKSEEKDYVLPRIQSWLNGNATKVIQGIQDELGINRTNYHSLRASFITHLLREGVSLIQVREMVGHSDLKTTQRYIRLDATDLIGATEALEKMDENTKVLELSIKKS